jgi:uncharacterized protein YjiS (DUF1127 family)
LIDASPWSISILSPQQEEDDMQTDPTIWHRAARTLSRIGDRILVTRRRRALVEMPDYLLKDIGWPTSESDCCSDRSR